MFDPLQSHLGSYSTLRRAKMPLFERLTLYNISTHSVTYAFVSWERYVDGRLACGEIRLSTKCIVQGPDF